MTRIAMVGDVAGVATTQVQLLREAGHDVDHLRLPGTGATWPWPAKAAGLGGRLPGFLGVARQLRTGRYDVVHIHWLQNGIVGMLSGRPFFVQAHGSDVTVNPALPGMRPLSKSVARAATAVFYVTPNLSPALMALGARVAYLPNPVALEPVERSGPRSTDSNVLVFTRLDPVKGADVIFPALDMLQGPVSVTAMRWGPLAAGYERRHGGKVRFINPVPHAAVADLLATFDVVIGQVRQGVLGLMEIEAMAAGLPVVAGVDPGMYGDDPPPVEPAADPASIACAVESLLADPGRRCAVGQAGRGWAIRNHGPARHLELLEAAYSGAA